MINLMNYTPNVLVIGDLMIDHYVWGKCERISPEAPVLILKVDEENNRLGGACNVANNLISLGAKVSLCGIVGDDSDGKILLKMLEDSNINTDLIEILNDFNTIKKTRLIATRQQVLRVDRECKIESKIASFDIAKVLNNIASKIDEFDSIVLSDYAKGALSKEFTQSIINLANSHNKPILCDPKGDDYSKYANATLITPNKKEAQSATNIKIDSKDSLLKAGFRLKEMCNLKYAVITLSEDGMAIFDSKMTEIPTLAREVFDVTGAGDTVISALTFGLSCGLDIYKSAEFANAAAAVVVGKIGSASASLGEIFSYKNDISRDKDINIFSLIDELKKDGKKIVFTNGCFDILHVGHITYLKKARSFGDILVVGLNSDNSVKNLKGKDRPINRENDRAFVLDSLSCVDFVIIFDEDTPYDLIKKIKPDILVKGGDYINKNVVGSDIVKDVRIVDFVPNASTTNIVNKIKGE